MCLPVCQKLPHVGIDVCVSDEGLWVKIRSSGFPNKSRALAVLSNIRIFRVFVLGFLNKSIEISRQHGRDSYEIRVYTL